MSELRREWPAGLLWSAMLAGALAVAVGVALGDPGSGVLVPLTVALGLGIMVTIVAMPFAGLLVLAFSLFVLVVVFVPSTQRSVNVFDIVLVPLLAAAMFSGARREAARRDGLGVGLAHHSIQEATHALERGTVCYFGLAALSLLLVFVHAGSEEAVSSGLKLVRAMQGALVFPLGLIWLTHEGHVRATLRTVYLGALVFAVVNCIWVFGLGYPRAGLVWWIAETQEPTGSPNEAGTALVVLWALLQSSWALRARWWHVALMGLVLLMLPLTQSRSGMLAFVVFLLLTVRRVRWRWVAASLVMVSVVLLLLPTSFWVRMAHSLSLERGSFALFGLLLRLYGFGIAWHVFLAHPILGVGYLGLRFVSPMYNEFHLVVGAENYFLETLAGMGIAGFAVLSAVFVRLFALGRVVGQSSPPGTLGHELARRHGPLLIALLVANLTGDNFVGTVGVGQLALWCALLVRAGHLAIPRAEAA